MLTSQDQTWTISFAGMWIVIEANLLVICVAMTTLRKFFRHVAPTLMGSSQHGSRSRTGKTRETPRKHYAQRSERRLHRQDPYIKFGDDTGICSTLGKKRSFNAIALAERSDYSTWEGRIDGDSEKAIVQTRSVTVHCE
ncbi:putative Integral membrane protein [Seiridium cardinale]